ncbi:uncharacterized protein LOC133899891 [Phragmites australis]|uniref:uncharacterized protein LOC133899891 n=1 Tax=Phragmites australis TaxID=29695 RepID=UPI002D799A0C|nr:uncharacterized protein LOC133899891 [Phragmites australis]
MKQWKSLIALHSSAPSCFPQPPSPSPCPSPRRDPPGEDGRKLRPEEEWQGKGKAVRLVGCDGQVRTYRPPLTARELMQQHPRHLVCRADALLIGEKIPAVAPAEELQPGQAYFLLPAHLFRSVLSFVSLASSLLLLLSAAGNDKNGKSGKNRPFELHRTDSGTLQIKFSDDFLVGSDPDAANKDDAQQPKKPAVLRGDERLEKEYEELVGYGKSRRWAPKLETIQEVVVVAAAAGEKGAERRKSRSLPFLGRLGSRRRRDACGNGSAVACSG